MNILIVSDSFFPNMTMNGVVVKNLVDELMSNNKVYVLSYGNKLNYKYRDTEVFNINQPNIYRRSKIERFQKRVNIIKSICSLIIKMDRCFSFIIRNSNVYGINIRFSKKVANKIEFIIKQKNIDTILLVMAPFDILYAGYLLIRKRNIKIIGYQIDYYSTLHDYYILPHSRGYVYKKRSTLLKQCSDLFDKYYMLPFIYEKEGNVNCKICNLPLIKEKKEFYLVNKKISNEYILTYTGTLSDERPPNKIIEFLIQFKDTFNLKIHFYHRGNMNTLINKYCKKYPKVVINHGTKPTAECYNAMANSDFLISIATLEGNQIAGKTYEYISSCKPIIYFYFNEKDLNAKYLMNYNFAFCFRIKNRYTKEEIDDFKNFLSKYKGKENDFNIIRSQFIQNTPSYIVKKFFNKENINEKN